MFKILFRFVCSLVIIINQCLSFLEHDRLVDFAEEYSLVGSDKPRILQKLFLKKAKA